MRPPDDRPSAIEQQVEDSLLRIAGRVLGTAEVDVHRSLAEQGADSLAIVLLAAEILREFGSGLTSEDILDAPSIGAIRSAIARRLSEAGGDGGQPSATLAALTERLRPRQGPVTGPVPLIANRHSYFLKRRRNLHYWNVSSGLLESRDPVDPGLLEAVGRELAAHHDGLRLQAWPENGDWNQVVVAPEAVDPVITLRYEGRDDSDALRAFVEGAVGDVQAGFQLPGELFRILHIRLHRTSLLFVVAHHLLVDAYAYGLVFRDLFTLYQHRLGQGAGPLPPKTTSLLDYSAASTAYWRLHAPEEARYWRSLRWNEVAPLRADCDREANIEAHTAFSVVRLSAGDTGAVTRLLEQHPQDLVVRLLSAIATAYRAWTGHPVLLLAMVFHGRESFVDGMDLTRTAGWISETVPLVLRAALPLDELIDDTRQQVVRAGSRGKSYGVLKYLSGSGADALDDLPSPEISLNVRLPPRRDPPAAIEMIRPAEGFRLPPADLPATERVFLLSGGAFFERGRFCLSWDFSTRIFDPAAVDRFTRACVRDLRRTMSARGAPQNALPS